MNTQKWLRWGGLVVLAAVISAPVARAQTSPSTPQGESANQRADLKLSDEQKAKMQEIRKGTQEQVQAIRQDASLTTEQKREKTRAIKRNARLQSKGILSPEQFHRYQRRAHNRREHRRGHKHGDRPPRPRQE